MPVVIQSGSNTNVAGVDANGNLLANLPTNPLQAGTVQKSFLRDAATARIARITEEGDLYTGQKQLLFRGDFNNATATPMSAQWQSEATTMTMAQSAGFLRLNATALTTINTGVQIHSYRTMGIEDGAALSVRGFIRHTNAGVANKQMEFGLGFANPVAGQSSAMNEFAGFRWTTAGALQGVLEYSTGGAPTSLTVAINGGVPFSDNVARQYEIIISDDQVEFWINNVYQASIQYAADSPGVMKACGYPVWARVFNGGSLPASAPVLDIGDISVVRIGPGADISHPYRRVLGGHHCIYNQPGLTATDGQTALVPASGTAPTAATGSNIATTFTGLGGFYRMNAAAVTATAHSNIILSDYTNPTVPTAAGAANDARNLVITDIMISPMVVTTVLAGGGWVHEFFVAIGGTAVTLAGTTTIGTTAVGQKQPRIIPLPIFDTFAATAAVGTVGTRQGDNSIRLATPIVVHPGEHIQIGIRTLYVLAAATSGTIDGGIGFSGYWD